jgi:dTDP-4-amino-4,6-dideoxygalactose transaminase
LTRISLFDLAAQEAAVAGEVLVAIEAVAREGRFVLGPRVEAFERWLAGACGVEHAVSVASGTDALELSLRALGVGQGDAVVTPAVSFIAAAEAIANVGARPVFCDVDPVTMNVGPASCEAAIARARRADFRLRAILPVHLFGRCAPMPELVEIAAREHLCVVEDAAQALGARGPDGRAAGAFGDTGCFSFFPTKNLGAWGDGGAIVTSNEVVAATARKLRVHGGRGAGDPYVNDVLGRNSRLDALQAAVLLTKSRHVEDWRGGRARVAARYSAELRGLPLELPLEADAPGVHAWHAYVVRCDDRDGLREHLRADGIESRAYYPVPLHRQPCFAHLEEPPLPVAEALCRRSLALPVYAVMTDDQIARVVASVGAFF